MEPRGANSSTMARGCMETPSRDTTLGCRRLLRTVTWRQNTRASKGNIIFSYWWKYLIFEFNFIQFAILEIEPLVRENHLQNIRINIFTKFSSNCEFKTSIFRQGIHVLLQIYHVIDIKGTHDIIFDIQNLSCDRYWRKSWYNWHHNWWRTSCRSILWGWMSPMAEKILTAVSWPRWFHWYTFPKPPSPSKLSAL